MLYEQDVRQWISNEAVTLAYQNPLLTLEMVFNIVERRFKEWGRAELEKEQREELEEGGSWI